MREMRKYFRLNDNENATYPSVWDSWREVCHLNASSIEERGFKII